MRTKGNRGMGAGWGGVIGELQIASAAPFPPPFPTWAFPQSSCESYGGRHFFLKARVAPTYVA